MCLFEESVGNKDQMSKTPQMYLPKRESLQNEENVNIRQSLERMVSRNRSLKRKIPIQRIDEVFGGRCSLDVE